MYLSFRANPPQQDTLKEIISFVSQVTESLMQLDTLEAIILLNTLPFSLFGYNLIFYKIKSLDLKIMLMKSDFITPIFSSIFKVVI